LTLEDCSLAVNGDVRLEGDRSDQRVLQGSNASLIVHGTLIVDNGEMEAGTETRMPNLDLSTCALASVRLEYGPQYMRSLNQFGPLRTLAIERRTAPR
jgi:hypothetical protein